MGYQDTFFTVGNEAVAYGTTAATLTRGIEQKPGNTPTPNIERRQSGGYRPGRIGMGVAADKPFENGGTLPVRVDLLSKSHGLLLAAVGSSVATTTPVGATDARLHTITPTTAGVTRSSTIHSGIPDDEGNILQSDFLGAMATQLAVSVSPLGLVELAVDYNYKTHDTSVSSVTPAWPSDPHYYTDRDSTITLDGNSECARALDLTIPSNIKVDRNRICPGGREKPVSLGMVAPTGNLTLDFADYDAYAAWIAGTDMPLVYEVTGPEIEAGFNFFVRFTFPAIKYTGSAPEDSIEDLTAQPLPWQAFDNDSDPLWKIEYQTTDTTP